MAHLHVNARNCWKNTCLRDPGNASVWPVLWQAFCSSLSRLTEAGILQAAFELANPPTHLTIVGKKDDPQALVLFKTALAFPAIYRRVEWWDKREGAMPNPDVQYPAMPRAAAFVCGDGRCSIPVYGSAALTELTRALTGSKPKALPSISAGGGG